MYTEIAQTETVRTTKNAVNDAVMYLQGGDVVALPTETVYGLAADALDPTAVAKIFEAKERPAFDPLIVHLPYLKTLHKVAVVPDNLRETIDELIKKFWPGPLTLVLPKTDAVPDIVTAGLPTVAVRMSDHEIFKKIIHALNRPIAAPSANRFGRISPTSAMAVHEELEGRIPLIVDGGACARGLESTIIRLEKARGPKPFIHILRNGPITAEDLKKYGKIVREEHNEAVEGNAPEAPGMLASHYAPSTPLRLLTSPQEFQAEPGRRYALLSFRGEKKDGYLKLTDWVEVVSLSPGSGKLPEAGIRFFHLLRKLDELEDIDEIIAEPIPDRGVGAAIMERLRKAAAKSAV